MKLLIFNNQISNIQSRLEVLDGRNHLVVPMVALVEGVHCGSGGPALYLEDEFSQFVESWNGVPLPVMHPQDEAGMRSANTPETINAQSVGRFFNARIDDHKLKGEAWIDIEKAKTIYPAILDMIHSGQPLQVSTSFWSQDDFKTGDWNGEHYDAIIRGIRPDHIALLPGAEGACSWEDGCGIRANKKEGGDMLELTDEQLKALEEEGKKGSALGKKLKTLFLKTFGFGTNEMSHDDVWSKLQGIINEKDTPSTPSPGLFHYVRDVYDDYFVYEARVEGEEPKLFSQEFTVNDDEGSIKLKGKPKEVRMDKNYVALMQQRTNKKEVTDNMKREEAVKILIANEQNQFCEEDRDFLMGLDDAKFEKIEVLSRPVKETPKEEPKAMEKVEPKVEPKEEKVPVTTEDFLANAPAEVKESIEAGLKMLKEKKTKLVDALSANKNNKFSKEDLEKMEISMLENLVSLAHVDPDYSGSVGAGTHAPKANEKQADGSGIPDMPAMTWNKDGSPDFSHLQ